MKKLWGLFLGVIMSLGFISPAAKAAGLPLVISATVD
jgi:hypothetical protein